MMLRLLWLLLLPSFMPVNLVLAAHCGDENSAGSLNTVETTTVPLKFPNMGKSYSDKEIKEMEKQEEQKEPVTDASDVCCRCPALDVKGIKAAMHSFGAALDEVVPGRWWLESGTLLAALRYGTDLFRLKSGKINFVDQDVDFGVHVKPSEEKQIIKKLGALIHFKKKQGKLYTFGSNASYPQSCGKGDNSTKGKAIDELWTEQNLYLQLKVRYEIQKENTSKVELECPGGEPKIDNLLNVTLSCTDQILPLKDALWTSGPVKVPNHYLLVTSLYNDQEYGNDGRWKHLWKPARLVPVLCPDTPCEMGKEDYDEVASVIRHLHDKGYASFYELVRESEAGPTFYETFDDADRKVEIRNFTFDTRLIAAYQKLHPNRHPDDAYR